MSNAQADKKKLTTRLSEFSDKSFGGRFMKSIGQDLFTKPAVSSKTIDAAAQKLELSGEFDKAKAIKKLAKNREFSAKRTVATLALSAAVPVVAVPLLLARGVYKGMFNRSTSDVDQLIASASATPQPGAAGPQGGTSP